MNVTHFEPGPLAGQSARTKRGDAALVGHFGKRVVLIHELRQLTGAEEFLDNRRHRLRVDELLRHELLGLGQTQALLDGAFDPDQTDTELVLRHLSDAANAPIPEMVDVVDHTDPVLDVDESLERVDDVRLVIVLQNEIDELLVIPTSLEHVDRLPASIECPVDQLFGGKVILPRDSLCRSPCQGHPA